MNLAARTRRSAAGWASASDALGAPIRTLLRPVYSHCGVLIHRRPQPCPVARAKDIHKDARSRRSRPQGGTVSEHQTGRTHSEDRHGRKHGHTPARMAVLRQNTVTNNSCRIRPSLCSRNHNGTLGMAEEERRDAWSRRRQLLMANSTTRLPGRAFAADILYKQAGRSAALPFADCRDCMTAITGAPPHSGLLVLPGMNAQPVNGADRPHCAECFHKGILRIISHRYQCRHRVSAAAGPAPDLARIVLRSERRHDLAGPPLWSPAPTSGQRSSVSAPARGRRRRTR